MVQNDGHWRTSTAKTFQRTLFCFSLSNILLLPFWGRVFSFGTVLDKTFLEAFNSGTFDRLYLIAGVLVSLGLTAAFCGGRLLLGQCRSVVRDIIVNWVLVASLIIVLPLLPYHSWLEFQGNDIPQFPRRAWLPVCLVLVVGAGWYLNAAATLAKGLVVIAIPIAVVINANAISGAIVLTPKGASHFAYLPLATPVPNQAPASRRVLWFVFDELDQRLTFDQRPNTVEMPNFDHFAKLAFAATNAQAPSGLTSTSLMALLTGEFVAAANYTAGGQVSLTFANSSEGRPVAELQTVFSDVRSAQRTTAVFGQLAYSYCRLFPEAIHKCWDGDDFFRGSGDTVFRRIGKIIVKGWRQIEMVLNGHDRFTGYNVYYIDDFKRMVSSLAATAADRKYEFVFAHLRTPHEPFIYNRFKNDYDPSPKPEIAYLNNLELTDRVLAAVWEAMSATGTWDDTTVIISADHWWRKAHVYDGVIDKRIPFLVKLAGNSAPMRYDRKIQTYGTRNLIKAIFDGRVTRHDQIAAAMDVEK